jgi:CDP-paratose 2-epimerase
MKNILITGGCGFVGSNLSEFLQKKNFNISTLDNLSRNGSYLNLVRLSQMGIRNYKLDISKKDILNKIKKFDLIIDCCAEASVQMSRFDMQKSFDTNLVGTFNILKKCAADNSNIIFLSSSRVYSLISLNKIIRSEKILKPLKINKQIDINFDTSSPKTLYGFTKLASEELIKEFSYLYNIKYIINRCGVISGPWQFGKVDQGFISFWVWQHINKKKIKYIGYGGLGHQVRDVLHVNDLCELIFLQIKNIKYKNNITYSVGGGLLNAISLSGLTKLCEKITHNKLKIKKVKRTSAYDVPYFVTSITKVKSIYKWKPKKNITDIVYDIFCWQKNNLNKLKSFF